MSSTLIMILCIVTVIDSTSFTTQQDLNFYRFYYKNKILFKKYVTNKQDYIINETLCKTIQSMFNDK